MRFKDWIGLLALAAFASVGLFEPVSTCNASAALTLAWVKPLLYVGVGALIFGCAYVLRRRARAMDGSACRVLPLGGTVWVFAAACSLCLLLDRCFLRFDRLPFSSVGEALGFLWAWASATVVLACAVRLALCAPRARSSAALPSRTLWLFFGVLLLCWSPHIVLQFPGHIETTAGQQIRQCFGQEAISADNPLFHTLLIKLVLKGSLRLGMSDTLAVFMLSLMQLLPLALALSWSALIVGRRCGRGAAFALLAFYALCPLFPLYGLFIVKDVPFATAVLLCTCELTVLLANPTALQKPAECVRYFALCCYLCLMRNMALLILLLIAAGLYRRCRGCKPMRRRVLALSLAVLGVVGAFQLVATPLLHVQTLSHRQAENRSLQCQLLARVVREHADELSADDLAIIDRVLPAEGMGERYNPELSDPIKDTWREGVSNADKLALDGLTARLVLAYPLDCASAVLRMGLPYLAIGDTGRFRSIFDCGFSDIDAIAAVFRPKHLFSSAEFRKPLDALQHMPVITLFCCGGLYAWLLIGGLLLARRRGLPCAAFLPALAVLGGCLLSPVAGYVRYALPYMLAASMLFVLACFEPTRGSCSAWQ